MSDDKTSNKNLHDVDNSESDKLREQIAKIIWSVRRGNPRQEIVDDIMHLLSTHTAQKVAEAERRARIDELIELKQNLFEFNTVVDIDESFINARIAKLDKQEKQSE